MKGRIAIDQDQVVADILCEWLRRYNEDYQDDLKPEQIVEWNWDHLVKPKCGKKIYSYLDDPQLFENLPIIEGSQEVIRKLSETHEIFFVTAPFNPNNVVPKHIWLDRHFPFVPDKNYVFTRNKSIIQADYLIDDKPENLLGFSSGIRLLFDAPHNHKEDRFIRMRDWYQIERFFQNHLVLLND